ncbi:MAG TPA: nucleoside 2-deoxyribosyltransferase [Candidatus Saccharimonadales bacterium]|nr:nucleoside 2-deoxyribosyltransferase [Candidatus Saccharimonadales bacterium]
MKKVYFACSVRGGRDDKHIYQEIVSLLRSVSVVTTEFNIDKDLTPKGTPGATGKTYKRDMEMLRSSDVIVAEVTTPSLGVGYEISKAEEMNMPILCLFRPSSGISLSAMVAGNPNVKVIKYEKVEELEKQIKSFLISI